MNTTVTFGVFRSIVNIRHFHAIYSFLLRVLHAKITPTNDERFFVKYYSERYKTIACYDNLATRTKNISNNLYNRLE